jgi:predicted alpha/beta hydrolase
MTPPPGREQRVIELTDGATVRAARFVPAAPRASIVLFPALGVEAAYYEPLALALASRDLAVVTADLRGLGGSSVRPRRGVDFGYARLIDDAAVVLAAAREATAGPVYALGHSLGGHVAALVAGLRPDAMDGLVLVAAGTPYVTRFRAATAGGLLVLSWLVQISGTLLGYVPGRRFRFGGTEAAQLMSEWARLARSGRFRIDGIDAERALASARVPALVVSIEDDWLAPRAAVDHLASKLAQAAIERRHVTAADADPRALDHFRWARVPEVAASVIARWIAARDGIAPRDVRDCPEATPHRR